jgi:hypothetical protein
MGFLRFDSFGASLNLRGEPPIGHGVDRVSPIMLVESGCPRQLSLPRK